MDNFRRKNNQHQAKQRMKSTDGFTVRGSHNLKINRRADSAKQAGSFKQGDGFHPRNRDRRPLPNSRRPVRDSGGAIRLDLPKDTSSKKPRTSLFSRLRLKHKPRLRTAALVLVIAFGSYFITSAYLKARQVFQGGGAAVALQDNLDPSRLNGEGDGRINILLLGMDDAAGLTDSLIVVSIDPIHSEAALVSIPRDLYVEAKDMGSMKINEVFPNTKQNALSQQSTTRQADVKAYQAVQDSVSDVLGVPMHYYASIDFEGFSRAINTVGGVTLDVEDPLYEVLLINERSFVLDVKPGRESFDGERALAYVRSRKTSPRGDFDRSERQRDVLIALKEKILSAGTLSNPARLNALFHDFADNTETSFSAEEILRLNEIGSKIDTSTIESIELIGDEPNDFIASGNIGGLSIQVPTAGMYEYGEIHNYIRNKLRDGYLRSEDATVLVLNGTQQPGLATLTTDHLKSFGYSVKEPQNASVQDFEDTILVDMTKGEKKYTKRYLEQRFKTFASTKLPKGIVVEDKTADFVIIIGQNEISRIQN